MTDCWVSSDFRMLCILSALVWLGKNRGKRSFYSFFTFGGKFLKFFSRVCTNHFNWFHDCVRRKAKKIIKQWWVMREIWPESQKRDRQLFHVFVLFGVMAWESFSISEKFIRISLLASIQNNHTTAAESSKCCELTKLPAAAHILGILPKIRTEKEIEWNKM